MSREMYGTLERRKILNTVNAFIFVLVMIVRSFTAKYESAGFISQVKYIIYMAGVFIAYYIMKRYINKRLFVYEFKNIRLVVIVFTILSIIMMVHAGDFTTRTIKELFFLFIPVLYAYLLINTLSMKIINKCMYIILIISILGYFLELGLNFSGIIYGLKSMDFRSSYSLLESNSFAGCSIALAIYFLYFRENKIAKVLSILFVILTFKRLAILFVIILWLFSKVVDPNIEVKKWVLNLTKIMFVGLTVLYFWMMMPTNVAKVYQLYNINLYDITMSRTYRFNILYNSGFISTGLGSSNTFLTNMYGVTLEMDLLRVMFEIGIIGVIVMVNNFFNIVKKNLYCFLIMVYSFLNLLTSHSLAEVFSWTIIYITIGCIIYKKEEHSYVESLEVKKRVMKVMR